MENAAAAIPPRTWKIAAVTGAGAFMAMLDATVANLALETIRTEFSSRLAVVQWVSSAYLIALAISLPATAWLGSRHGYGRTWFAATLAFVAGSALCGFADSPFTLIVARILQGFAAGIMVPAGQAVISAIAGRDQLGRIFGVLGLAVALGPALGPAFGGWLIETASWRWLFWINVPVGLIAVAVARGLVPDGRIESPRKLDAAGLMLVAGGLPLMLYAATDIDANGFTARAVALFGLGALLVAAFMLITRTRRDPLIDIRLLGFRAFLGATLVALLSGVNMFGGLLVLPLYLHLGMETGIAATGGFLLAMGLGSALLLPVAGWLTDRYGARFVILGGVSLLCLTLLPFILLPRMDAGFLIVILLLRGAAIAMTQMPAMTAAYGSVARDDVGDATTLINIAQRVGGAVGAVGIAIALDGREDDPLAFSTAFVLLLVAALAAFLPAAMISRRPLAE